MNIHKVRRRLRNTLKRISNFLYKNKKQVLFEDIYISNLEVMDDSRQNNPRSIWKRVKKVLDNPRILYPGYVILGSVLCIMLAQFAEGSKFRVWYYHAAHAEQIPKGVQYMLQQENQADGPGTFLTYYRFQSFGESDPSQVDTNAPMIALTFDDGPNPSNTSRILEVLNANYSHATFFVVGTNAESYPDTLKAISSAGCEIGNHTYNHANLTQLEASGVEEEIEKVNRAVKKATGENTTVIRPPYGAYNDSVLQQLGEPVVLWDLDTEDWSSRNAQEIVDTVMAGIKDGDIVLMHDIYESTAEAVEILVPKLKEQGYQILSVSEMAAYKGKTLELNKAYGKIEKGDQ